MHPSISVIIPAFNAAETIERCLRSVAAQTLPPIEIIVVDDGSSDATRELVQRVFGEIRPRMNCVLLSLPCNMGPSVARNDGIQAAGGEFIALLDSDDYWKTNHLEVCAWVGEQLRSLSFAVVHQPAEECDSADVELGDKNLRTVEFREFSLLYYLFIQKNCSTITLYAPRDTIKSVSFPPGKKFAEDFQFFVRLFRRADRRAYLKWPRTAVVGKHAWASGNGLSSKHWKMFFGVVDALVRELVASRYSILLVVLLPWHLLKFMRRYLRLTIGDFA